MDAAYTTRAMPPLPPVRADLTPQKQSVTTDLPQEKSVGMTRDTQGARLDAGDTRGRFAATDGPSQRLAAESRRQMAREIKVEVDEATSDLVYQTINPDTGDVIAQFPNEALMKIRAYVREDAVSSEAAPAAAPAAPDAPAAEIQHIERLV